ncbi:hypothetical protein [Paenibacillus herberti]|uniref:CBM6 domain-containing protein n=1 Tax=Paenibacillus herberti TaxID=1619309 RepID=A0A229NXN4_9BACL|nr:hypothetical protein [Paenibacillus herberti]OXM14551.1 hypothetical protein CGZ75_16595 [Paenibacillus herberti]
MKKKSALLVGLSVLSLTAALTVASASPANNAMVPSENTTSSQGNEITPRGVMAVDNEIVNAPIAGSSYTKNFNIQANFGWVKVWVQNKSTETLTVRVTQSTLSGTQKMVYTVAPGSSWTEYGTKPWATGTHWISISTKNGGNMSGLLSVKLANTKEEL